MLIEAPQGEAWRQEGGAALLHHTTKSGLGKAEGGLLLHMPPEQPSRAVQWPITEFGVCCWVRLRGFGIRAS